MNKENSESAYDFDFNLISEFFLNAKRQGPGSEEATVKALNFIDGITKDTMIADLGCGTGCQTIYLANNTPAQITALDIVSESIEKLNNTIAQKNLGNRVKAITGSMHNLPFEKNSLDIIWSEGAIYHIGYEKACSIGEISSNQTAILLLQRAHGLPMSVRARLMISGWQDILK